MIALLWFFLTHEARRTFEENIARVLEDIELAKRLQRVAAAALHLDGELIDAIPSI
jgi:F0F1-type ATP synthase membrane subunit b/b'